MGRAGERTYVVFGTQLRKAGLGPEWEAIRRSSGSAKALIEKIAAMVPHHFPEGYRVSVVADLSAGPADGFAVRVKHESFASRWGSTPILLPKAEL